METVLLIYLFLVDTNENFAVYVVTSTDSDSMISQEKMAANILPVRNSEKRGVMEVVAHA
jgi:hypothetical protein